MAVISKITPALCRVPRGLLDMTQIDLAAGASVSKNTIVDFEKGRSTPVKNNLAAIQRVLEEAGSSHQWRRAGPAVAEEEAVRLPRYPPQAEATLPLPSSWPGLSRPSAPFLLEESQDVDARHKAGHDEFASREA